MSKASKSPTRARKRTTLTDKVDKQLAKREKYAARIAAAEERKARGLAKVNKRYAKDVGRAPEKLELLDENLAAFLKRHRYWLIRLHSKTIERAEGVIKYMTRPRELDLPADQEAIIEELMAYRGGEAFTNVKRTLDRDKILNAPDGVWAIVERHGGWRGRHRTISVTSPSSKVKRLSRERHNDRS